MCRFREGLGTGFSLERCGLWLERMVVSEMGFGRGWESFRLRIVGVLF